MILTSSQTEAFEAVLAQLTPEARRRVDALSISAVEAAVAAGRHWDIAGPARAVEQALGPHATDDERRALIAIWAMRLSEVVAATDLPGAVTELYPFWMDRLSEFLVASTRVYEVDFWIKDVRLVLGLSVPGARSQIIDLYWPMGMGETVRHALGGRGIGPLVRYVTEGAHRPWLQNHTESRHLIDFTPDGWDHCWATAAEICKVRPDVAGMMGASWFYDPQLVTVSPRLAYLQANPVANGAWLVHQGPGAIHTERAATKSETRKAMIEAGTYVPQSWLLAWPRKALIRWSEGRTLG